MGDRVTTALDVLGLLLIAAGIGWAVGVVWWPPAAPAAAGVTITAVSITLAAMRNRTGRGQQ